MFQVQVIGSTEGKVLNECVLLVFLLIEVVLNESKDDRK